MDGSTTIDELSVRLGWSPGPSGVYSTLAGLLLAELGRIPVVGDTISTDGYKLVVRKMDNLRIESILVQKLAV
jgi:CBS domain containing-hemolysin-like protein